MIFYEFLWFESMIQILKVEVIKFKKFVFKLCSELIGKYREGKGNSIVVDGKEFVVKEVVFYINDVFVIKNIIKKNGLKVDEVNIICFFKLENIKKLNELFREVGEKFMIGDILGKGELYKMFIFCIFIVYIGVDFYFINVYFYIFVNLLVKSMIVDVLVDL